MLVPLVKIGRKMVYCGKDTLALSNKVLYRCIPEFLSTFSKSDRRKIRKALRAGGQSHMANQMESGKVKS